MGKLNINNGGIDTNKVMPDIDERFGPYASIEAANTALGASGRDCITAGLTVGITQGDGSVKEYWYQPQGSGLALIPKQRLSGSPVAGDFASFDSNGDIVDSGHKHSDYATAAQGTKADTAYQKPSGGIPATDLASAVQTSLGKADAAVQEVTVGTTTTGAAGTNASVSNSGTTQAPVLNFTIPRGADGQNGADAVNPFKGWWPDLATLKAAITATPGDSAYVKDASPATTWSIYIYDSTASSDNYWADSGTDADTSNVQTFETGEHVNEVSIVNNLTTGGVHDVLSAEQGKLLGSQLLTPIDLPYTYDGSHTVKSTGISSTTSQYYGLYKTDVSNYIGNTVVFLGFEINAFDVGAAFFDTSNNIISNTYITFQKSGSSGFAKQYSLVVPQEAKYLMVTSHTSYNPSSSYYVKTFTSKFDVYDEQMEEFSEQIESTNNAVAEIESKMIESKPLTYTYDGSHVVKPTGLDTTTSANYGLYKTDVSSYIGRPISFLGFIAAISFDVGASFFDASDNIISASYLSFQKSSNPESTADNTEFTAVVPQGAKYLMVTTNTGYNIESIYYVKVFLNPDFLNAYPCYHTDTYKGNFNSYQDLIAAYDDLVTRFPNYIYKTQLSANGVPNGIVSDGVNVLYEYRLALPNYNDTNLTNNNRSRDAQIKKPKILICGGVHGYEISAITSVYILAKDLCEGVPSLSELKAGFDIRIIPSCNPYGLNNRRRGNANGVDINRNFIAEGQTFEPSTSRTSGYDYTVNCGSVVPYDKTTSMAGYTPGVAGDQPETKLVSKWALENNDAVAFFDTHNSLYSNEFGYLGSLTHLDDGLKRYCFNSVDKSISYLINYRGVRYPFRAEGASSVSSVFLYTGGARLGHTGIAGTMSQFRLSNDISGGTLEFCNEYRNQGGYRVLIYSMMTCVLGAEMLGNIIIGVVNQSNVTKEKTVCSTSELPKFGRNEARIAWNTTTNKPMLWNGTGWVNLQVEN